MLPDSRRIYPQGELAGQVIGTVGIDNQGLTGLEASEDERPARHRRRARGHPRRARRRARARHDRRRRGRLRPEADARRQPSRPRPSGCSPGIGETYEPDGATAIVMDPRSSRDPGDGQLARASIPSDLGDAEPEDARQHGDRLHLRARLDLQGVHGRRRARGGRSSRRTTTFDLPPTIQVADRTIEESHDARLRHALGRRHPRPVLERRRGHDRPRAQRQLGDAVRRRFDYWIRRFGFGEPTGIAVPGRGAGDRARRPRTTPARRWATCRSARASR